MSIGSVTRKLEGKRSMGPLGPLTVPLPILLAGFWGVARRWAGRMAVAGHDSEQRGDRPTAGVKKPPIGTMVVLCAQLSEPSRWSPASEGTHPRRPNPIQPRPLDLRADIVPSVVSQPAEVRTNVVGEDLLISTSRAPKQGGIVGGMGARPGRPRERSPGVPIYRPEKLFHAPNLNIRIDSRCV